MKDSILFIHFESSQIELKCNNKPTTTSWSPALIRAEIFPPDKEGGRMK